MAGIDTVCSHLVCVHINKLTEVFEVPELTDEDKRVCFISTEHWVSIDTDIEITSKRWNNHIEGSIPFDEDNNTIRGIEVCL